MIKKAVVGVDVGGSKIITGVLTQEGKILGKPINIPTGGQDPSEVIVNRIHQSIEKALKTAGITFDNIQGIGLGVPGPLDIKNGVVLDPWQLPTMNNFPLRQVIQTRYQVPVYMNNDANCFLLGESYFGAGVGLEIVFGLTLGTGLGAAIVIDGKLLLGATETAGEVWFSPYKDEFIEAYVSGRGITRTYKKLTGKEKSSLEIAELGHLGEAEAVTTWEEFGTDLAYCIAWYVNILDPDIVILGGSIANAMDLFSPAMEKYLRQHICPIPATKTKVTRAALEDSAGFIGAACLVLQKKRLS